MREAAAIKYRLSVVSPLERRLREWGLAYGIRLPREDVEPEAESPIAKVTVDRSRERDVRVAEAGWRPAPRVNLTRERIQAMVGSQCRVPSWAGGDPIRCKATNGGGGGSWSPPAEAEQVEVLVLALGRWDVPAALSLRASYCLIGRRPLSERMAWVADKGAGKITRMGYRASVARGRMIIGADLRLEC